jgi:hypothetical protein
MAMPQHIDDEILDRYASGSLHGELLAAVEEHWLACPRCQSRLIEADEFIGLFRAVARQPDARPQSIWSRLFSNRLLGWTGAAAVFASVLLFISVEFRKAPVAIATVSMQALRGPEAVPAIAAGKPARLVFDLLPAGTAQDYQIQIVNALGTQVLSSPAESNDGHLSLLVRKIEFGSYWVRIYRTDTRELIAEYALRAE